MIEIVKQFSVENKTELCIVKFTGDSISDLKLHLTAQERKTLDSIKLKKRQLEFVLPRYILHYILGIKEEVNYSEDGKPYLESFKLSISHSHHYFGVYISTQDVGLDIQEINAKLKIIAPKFIPSEQLNALNSDITSINMIWSIKESLFKYCPHAGVDFKTHLQVPTPKNKREQIIETEIKTDYFQKVIAVKVESTEDLVYSYTLD